MTNLRVGALGASFDLRNNAVAFCLKIRALTKTQVRTDTA